MPSIDTIAVLGLPLSEESQAQLRAAFKTVHYRPDFTLPAELSGDVDIILGNWQAIPPEITLADLPRLKHIQMSTAGVDVCLRVCPAVQELARTKAEKGIKPEEGITISNASGIHVLSIPPWIVGNVVVLYQQLQQFLINARVSVAVADSEGVILTVQDQGVVDPREGPVRQRDLLLPLPPRPYRRYARLRRSGSRDCASSQGERHEHHCRQHDG
jgi:hypothetical protein